MLKSEIAKKIMVTTGLAILISVSSICTAAPTVTISDQTAIVYKYKVMEI